MGAKIDFDDSTTTGAVQGGGGAATLKPSLNSIDAVARFSGWQPVPKFAGEAMHRLSTFQRDAFVFRLRRVVRFSISPLFDADVSVAERLIMHLTLGGRCALTTGDLASHIYADMGICQDEPAPALSPRDPQTLERVFTATLEYVGTGTPPVMICDYWP